LHQFVKAMVCVQCVVEYNASTSSDLQSLHELSADELLSMGGQEAALAVIEAELTRDVPRLFECLNESANSINSLEQQLRTQRQHHELHASFAKHDSQAHQSHGCLLGSIRALLTTQRVGRAFSCFAFAAQGADQLQRQRAGTSWGRIAALQEQLAAAKASYNQAMVDLEDISLSVHDARASFGT
jgi:TolA-binding protein